MRHNQRNNTNSVTVICNGAFSFCYNLTNIAIPNSVITIEEMAFIYCSGLASITIPASITTIGTRAFDYCTALKTVYNNSSLNITKGATSNGNVAYYANVVINKNDDIIEDFVFGAPCVRLELQYNKVISHRP